MFYYTDSWVWIITADEFKKSYFYFMSPETVTGNYFRFTKFFNF